jgi:phosphohistidine phosphatase
MARRLLLLRHLKSSWDDPGLSDHERPLAPRGRKAGKALRRYLSAGDVSPQVVLCSSAVRTVQTWDAIKPAFTREPEVVVSDDLYLADPSDILHRLNELPETVEAVLVIGHNPAMEQLAADLTGVGDPDALARMRSKYPTGALAGFTIEPPWCDLRTGDARLDSFVVPRDLA